jgi:hypothetical protein
MIGQTLSHYRIVEKLGCGGCRQQPEDIRLGAGRPSGAHLEPSHPVPTESSGVAGGGRLGDSANRR